MQVKIRQVSAIWGIETLDEFFQHLDLSLNYRYSRYVTRFARKFWECQDRGKAEVTTMFLLDMMRAFHLSNLSDLLEFDHQNGQRAPIILENQPHLAVTSRIDDFVQAEAQVRGISPSNIVRNRIVNHSILKALSQSGTESEQLFFLSSLDKAGKALQIPTVDDLFEVRVVKRPLQLRTPRKAPTCSKGEAYERLTLSA